MIKGFEKKPHEFVAQVTAAAESSTINDLRERAAGGEDAAQAAINYGRLCAVALPALSIILNGVRRYHRRVDIRPDFENAGLRAYLETRFAIIPIAVAGHALMALLKMIFGEVKRRVGERMREETEAKAV